MRYASMQIVLHWLVAGLVLIQYVTSGAIVRTHQPRLIGRGPDPADLILHTVHNGVGLLIIVLTVARLTVRLWRAAPAPSGDPHAYTTRVARATHWTFYLILIAQGITGAVASYFWWPISAIHVVLFKVLLGLLIVHMFAALWHHFAKRDDTLKRIFWT
jgi:cytochrome b561